MQPNVAAQGRSAIGLRREIRMLDAADPSVSTSITPRMAVPEFPHLPKRLAQWRFERK